MDTAAEPKSKKKAETKVLSWQEKKEVADKEEDVLKKDIQDLQSWIDMMGSMNDEKLKEYVKKGPADLKTKKGKTSKARVKSAGKSKSSTCNPIMASVLKFHKEQEPK